MCGDINLQDSLQASNHFCSGELGNEGSDARSFSSVSINSEASDVCIRSSSSGDNNDSLGLTANATGCGCGMNDVSFDGVVQDVTSRIVVYNGDTNFDERMSIYSVCGNYGSSDAFAVSESGRVSFDIDEGCDCNSRDVSSLQENDEKFPLMNKCFVACLFFIGLMMMVFASLATSCLYSVDEKYLDGNDTSSNLNNSCARLFPNMVNSNHTSSSSDMGMSIFSVFLFGCASFFGAIMGRCMSRED